MTRSEAYRRTVYRAGDVVVRVSRRSVSADAWMTRHRANQAWFIGAANPFSRKMPDRWNDAQHARLKRNLRVFEEGGGSLSSWDEPMLLAVADAATIRLMMRRYRQAAVLRVRLRRPAELIYRG
ncbi:DUF3293 domain-containing protein [Roseococcus sp.]|uniref:DUF3293 domain-containing protein n=1 Tax=Roseococcus sp. TaxID=2109646 RepID=UPI003BABB941